MARLRNVALVVLIAALVGCGQKEVTSADVKAPDPYASMTGEQKVDAIRKDTTIPDMQKHDRIAEAQKAAGLPVTGQ